MNPLTFWRRWRSRPLRPLRQIDPAEMAIRTVIEQNYRRILREESGPSAMQAIGAMSRIGVRGQPKPPGTDGEGRPLHPDHVRRCCYVLKGLPGWWLSEYGVEQDDIERLGEEPKL